MHGAYFLLEMGWFADHDESPKKVIDGATNLEVLCETATMNAKKRSTKDNASANALKLKKAALHY